MKVRKDGVVETQNVDVTANSIGLATGAKQDSQTALLTSIDGKDFATQTTLAALLSAISTASNQATIITALASLLTELQLKADLSETQPVSAASLPLPSGASTSANQSTIISSLTSLLTELQAKADLGETQPVSASQTGTWNIGSITTGVVAGTGATSLGKARDAAWSASATGVGLLAFRNDYSSGAFSNTAVTGTQGDYTPPSVEATGRMHSRVIYASAATALSSLNDTFDNTTSTANSGDITAGVGYTIGYFSFQLTVSNTPTDITFIIEEKVGSNYYTVPTGYWGKLVYTDSAIGGGIRRAIPFNIPPSGTYRITATATGVDASNTITLAESVVYHRTF